MLLLLNISLYVMNTFTDLIFMKECIVHEF